MITAIIDQPCPVARMGATPREQADLMKLYVRKGQDRGLEVSGVHVSVRQGQCS